MAPRLVLDCGDGPGVVITLDDHSDSAKQLLQRLPQSGTLLHSRRSGCEVFLALPPQLRTSGNEQIGERALAPGDVLVYSCPPNYRDAPPSEVVDSSEGYAHVGIAYDEGVRFATPAGFVDVDVVGQVTSSLSELRQLGESIRLAGSRPFALVQLRDQE